MKFLLIAIIGLVLSGCGQPESAAPVAFKPVDPVAADPINSPTPDPSPIATATATPVPTVTPTPSATATPSPTASATPSPTASATPSATPTPTPSPTPVFTSLNCTAIQPSAVYCDSANVGASGVFLDFSPYLSARTQIASVAAQNGVGQGQSQCTQIYQGRYFCSCVTAVFQDTITHQLSSPFTWCGTGVNTSTNFLTYL